MHWIDYSILGLYLAVLLAIGLYFLRRQESVEAYFVSDRKMGAGHMGLSVVATDVGGGFSIGLGGLGFVMGLSGSWLLFTGLVGAWLAAILLIPKVKRLGDEHRWLTFPDFLGHRFDGRIRLVAALVSGLGYAGFVGAQVLAGAKLAAVAFDVSLLVAVLVMAAVIIAYTAFGGLQAVVYTDSLQWAVLLVGLLGLALPLAWQEVGGLAGLRAALPPEFLRLDNVGPLKFITWLLTIVPIWFVGMTLYQRIYATRDVKTARRAFLLAGLLEYPLMAFAGAGLGMMARILFPEADPEMGLPRLIKEILPIGAVGVVLAAYFSAIMSTADSCLLASVGNLVSDIYHRHINPGCTEKRLLRLSRLATIGVGVAAVALALAVPQVLDLILLAYGFLVAGLFIPTLAALFTRRVSGTAALISAITGGGLVVALEFAKDHLPGGEPILWALPASLLALLLTTGIERMQAGRGHSG